MKPPRCTFCNEEWLPDASYDEDTAEGLCPNCYWRAKDAVEADDAE